MENAYCKEITAQFAENKLAGVILNTKVIHYLKKNVGRTKHTNKLLIYIRKCRYSRKIQEKRYYT